MQAVQASSTKSPRWIDTSQKLEKLALPPLKFPTISFVLKQFSAELPSTEAVLSNLVKSRSYHLLSSLRQELVTLFKGRSLAVSEAPDFAVSAVSVNNSFGEFFQRDLNKCKKFLWEMLLRANELERTLPYSFRFSGSVYEVSGGFKNAEIFLNSIAKGIHVPTSIINRILRKFDRKDTGTEYGSRVEKSIIKALKQHDIALVAHDLSQLLIIKPDPVQGPTRACIFAFAPPVIEKMVFMRGIPLLKDKDQLGTYCTLWNLLRSVCERKRFDWPQRLAFNLEPAKSDSISEQLMKVITERTKSSTKNEDTKK